MTSYITINNSEVDPNSPITADLMTKLRDNPLSIAEGTVGAPVTAAGWHPYNSTLNGTGTGVIYSFATNGTLATIESPTFVDGYEYMFIFDALSNSASAFSAVDFLVEFFRETTGSYTTTTLFTTGTWTNTNGMTGNLTLFYPRRSQVSLVIDRVNSIDGTFNYKSTVSLTTAQKVSKVRFSCSGSYSFDSGNIYMYRRRIL
jgi:hypothetical protein